MKKCWNCKKLGKCVKCETVNADGCNDFIKYKYREYAYTDIAKILGILDRKLFRDVRGYKDIIKSLYIKTGLIFYLYYDTETDKFHFEVE